MESPAGSAVFVLLLATAISVFWCCDTGSLPDAIGVFVGIVLSICLVFYVFVKGILPVSQDEEPW